MTALDRIECLFRGWKEKTHAGILGHRPPSAQALLTQVQLEENNAVARIVVIGRDRPKPKRRVELDGSLHRTQRVQTHGRIADLFGGSDDIFSQGSAQAVFAK